MDDGDNMESGLVVERSRRSRALFGLAILLMAGCLQAEPAKSRFLQAAPRGMSQEELRDALADFDDLFTANVKQAAIAIDDQSQTAATRKNTLLWQVRMIPACHTALEEADALKSYADMWTLCVRMRRFLQDGEGKGLFADQQDIAVQTAVQLENEIEQIGQKFLPSDRFNGINDSVETFAKSHPIRTGFANAVVRTTTTKEGRPDALTELLSMPLAPFRAMEGVDRGAQAIRGFTAVADHFTDVVEQLPEAARWQIQLFLYDLEENNLVRRFMAAAEQFAASSSKITEAAEKLPQRLREEGTQFIKDVDAHQSALQETLNRTEKAAATVEKALERVDVVSESIDRTAVSVAQAGSAWQSAAKTIGETVKGISGSQAEARPASTQPFDINDYRKTADAFTQTAAQMEKLAVQIQTLVESPKLTQQIQDVDTRAQAAVDLAAMRGRLLTDHIAWRAAELAVFVFVLALGYRFIAARVAGSATRA